VGRHNEMCSCTFVDGHSRTMKLTAVWTDDVAWFNAAAE